MSSYPYAEITTESSDDETHERDGGFQLYIYKSELNKIKNWVLQYKNIGTGGDLFGLWIDAHTAVVRFALGPGEKSRRSETSFFQDVHYLAAAGGYLTEKHGLCNIGQWLSHHQLSSSRPSLGDEYRVWANMRGLNVNRYIVCIANILRERNSYKTTLNCFLFEMEDNGEELPILHGKFVNLDGESPVNKEPEIAQVIAQGAAKPPDPDADDSKEGFLARCRSSFRKWLCSRQGKAFMIFALISIPTILFALVYLTIQ